MKYLSPVFKAAALITATVTLCCVICAAMTEIRCQRSKSPPEAPVYPRSKVVNHLLSGIGTRRPRVTFYYESTDSPENIVAFYEERSSCDVGEPVEGRELCRGNATPFGEYFVYISLDSYAIKEITTYAVEIWWRGCSDRLE